MHLKDHSSSGKRNVLGLSKLGKVCLLGLILLAALISSIAVVLFFQTHRLCYSDTGQPYYSDARPGSPLPCLLEPGANEVLRDPSLYSNGTFQIMIGDAGSTSVSIRQIVMTPSSTTIVSTETTTTCDGCSTQTFTMTDYPATPCVGLISLVSHNYTTERCTFSTTAKIEPGQTYEFSIQFSDGQELGDSVVAQST